MSANRERFLNRVQQNLQHALLPDASPEHPGAFQGYSFQADAPADKLLEQFTAELTTLTGQVHVLISRGQIISTILEIMTQHQADRLLCWDDHNVELPGLLNDLRAEGITVVDPTLPPDAAGRLAGLAALDEVRVGLTGAHGALADTGAIALISGEGRGRLASLLPPVHIALLPKSKLYPSLPAFLAEQPAAIDAGSNLVFIAGPSRTGDIEMILSLGVHGPGELHVLVW
jgi:L-lactate dehydrogenase complex protein LldG